MDVPDLAKTVGYVGFYDGITPLTTSASISQATTRNNSVLNYSGMYMCELRQAHEKSRLKYSIGASLMAQ
jgi:hypothetical protein